MIDSRRMGWARPVACTGKRRGSYSVLVGKSLGKSQFVEATHRWKYNIEMYLKEIFCEDDGWIDLAQVRDK